jgi:hypothetical protein
VPSAHPLQGVSYGSTTTIFPAAMLELAPILASSMFSSANYLNTPSAGVMVNSPKYILSFVA